MLAGLTAVLAGAGAVGLGTGSIDFGAPVMSRLPWHNVVLAAVALGVVVAVPMTVVAILAGRARRGYGPVAVLAGAMLVGWIILEIVIIREFSWLQPVFAAIGLLVVVLGRRVS